MNQASKLVIELAKQNKDIVIVWLYGSQTNNTANENSDYDLAVAFKSFIKDNPLEKRLRPECLALDWQLALNLRDFKLSVVDINQAPIPLAYQIINADCVLYCADEYRLWQEILRIESRMELDFLKPVKYYPLERWN
jgi:uncharacterized protein